MKSKYKKYILKNKNKKSIEELARELNMSDADVRKVLVRDQPVKQLPPFSLSSPFWFKMVLLVSILIRLHLVFSTEGTYDVAIWKNHVIQINKMGLIEYYRSSQNEPIAKFNHSPFMAFFLQSFYIWVRI